ncbi:hypothetical protein [Sphingomonas mucosissima]|nr:hypothetical protein [Sphingomonas mucosissima]
MIPALMLALQAAAPVQPASPRMLSGRFTCDAIVYEVQVTTAPLSATSAVLDRVTIGGKPVDAGSMAEARRMVARLADVQSIDVRCRAGGAGELSIYGTQAMVGVAPRRARLRGTL